MIVTDTQAYITDFSQEVKTPRLFNTPQSFGRFLMVLSGALAAIGFALALCLYVIHAFNQPITATAYKDPMVAANQMRLERMAWTTTNETDLAAYSGH